MPTAALLAQWYEFMYGVVGQTYHLMFRNQNLYRTFDVLLPKLISDKLDVAELAITERSSSR